MLAYMLIGMTFGVVTEVIARLLKLWVYREPLTPVLNVFVVSGLIMGSAAMLVPRHGMVLPFAVGFAVGLAYEVANLAYLKWWDFPNQQLGFIRGHLAIVVVASVGWGAVPLMTAGVRTVLPRLDASPRTALDRLTEREQVLTAKLAAVRQRTEDLEHRLAAVRRRKQRVLENHAGRRGEPLATPPAAAP